MAKRKRALPQVPHKAAYVVCGGTLHLMSAHRIRQPMGIVAAIRAGASCRAHLFMKRLNVLLNELDEYIGFPKCQDCGWKLGTAITDNCSCCGPLTKERQAKHFAAYARARELQGAIQLESK